MKRKENAMNLSLNWLSEFVPGAKEIDAKITRTKEIREINVPNDEV